MPVLMALVAVLGAIGVILWRLNAAADAAKGLADTAQDLAGLHRRWRWRRKAHADQLSLVDDPRMAAVAMMAAVAQADGAMTAAERVAILRLSVEKFGCTGKVAEEMLVYGRFLVRETHDPDNCFRRLTPLIQAKCGPQERADLLEMLRAVANADGPAGEHERQSIERFARGLA